MFSTLHTQTEQHARDSHEEERVVDIHEPASRSETPNTLVNRRDRRRGSISISRFGQLSELQSHSPNSGGLTPLAAQSPFYQAQAANMSNSSFASGASDLYDERAHREDYTQITQMHQIAGKQGLSKAVHTILPRRLSRTKSTSFLTPVAEANLVIGVSVQESTTVRLVSDTEPIQLGTTVTVSAPGGAMHPTRSSRHSLPTLPGTKWLAKVKSLTQNLRPNHKHPSLSQNVPSS